jgi:hypothetical protein
MVVSLVLDWVAAGDVVLVDDSGCGRPLASPYRNVNACPSSRERIDLDEQPLHDGAVVTS